MYGGKNNTQRIEALESQAANVSARLDVFDTVIAGLDELLKKCAASSEGHGTKITVCEERLVLIVELKAAVALIAPMREEFVAVKKDIESLQNWKAEQKKEKEESVKRLWSFGPNLVAALIAGVITLTGVALTYYLNRPK